VSVRNKIKRPEGMVEQRKSGKRGRLDDNEEMNSEQGNPEVDQPRKKI